MLGGGPVSWCSKKQSCVALSTAEAEFISLSFASQEAVWLKRIVSELMGCSDCKPVTILEDNQAAIAIATNNICLLYTSPSPRDKRQSRMPSSA